MKNYDVYGVGNALVDTEYEVDDAFLAETPYEKGMMTLIEEAERRDLITLLEKKHEHQVIKQAGGGSAANTCVAVSQLGGQAFYSCKVAADPVGDFFVNDLDIAGVDTNLGAEREPGTTGECISMVTPDAERTMTTHLGITQTLSEAELNPGALKAAHYLYIEGYLVSSPSGFEAALAAAKVARENNVAVTITLSDPAMAENFTAQFDEIIADGVAIIFCNEQEAQIYTGTNSREAAAAALQKKCERFVMTCGGEGALVYDNELLMVPGVPTTPVDTTGAGDIFAGAFLFAVARGDSSAEAAALANRCASQLVSSFGARLTQDQIDTLLNG